MKVITLLYTIFMEDAKRSLLSAHLRGEKAKPNSNETGDSGPTSTAEAISEQSHITWRDRISGFLGRRESRQAGRRKILRILGIGTAAGVAASVGINPMTEHPDAGKPPERDSRGNIIEKPEAKNLEDLGKVIREYFREDAQGVFKQAIDPKQMASALEKGRIQKDFEWFNTRPNQEQPKTGKTLINFDHVNNLLPNTKDLNIEMIYSGEGKLGTVRLIGQFDSASAPTNDDIKKLSERYLKTERFNKWWPMDQIMSNFTPGKNVRRQDAQGNLLPSEPEVQAEERTDPPADYKVFAMLAFNNEGGFYLNINLLDRLDLEKPKNANEFQLRTTPTEKEAKDVITSIRKMINEPFQGNFAPSQDRKVVNDQGGDIVSGLIKNTTRRHDTPLSKDDLEHPEYNSYGVGSHLDGTDGEEFQSNYFNNVDMKNVYKSDGELSETYLTGRLLVGNLPNKGKDIDEIIPGNIQLERRTRVVVSDDAIKDAAQEVFSFPSGMTLEKSPDPDELWEGTGTTEDGKKVKFTIDRGFNFRYEIKNILE